MEETARNKISINDLHILRTSHLSLTYTIASLFTKWRAKVTNLISESLKMFKLNKLLTSVFYCSLKKEITVLI